MSFNMDRFRKALNITKKAPAQKQLDQLDLNPTAYKTWKFGDLKRTPTISQSFLLQQYRYEQKVEKHPNDHQIWFNYALFVETDGYNKFLVRDIYKRATTQPPLGQDKDSWRTYIAIWISYALYEEMSVDDIDRARKVYRSCLDIIPHKIFTFSKVWLMYAQFEQRCFDASAAKAVLSKAIAVCPRNKLYQGFIGMEAELGNYENCRLLYKEFLEFQPENTQTWIDFAKMELSLGEINRARTIFILAFSQGDLDKPELLQEAYEEFTKDH